MKNFAKRIVIKNHLSRRFAGLAVALLIALAGVLTLLISKAATTTPTLYISPTTQEVTAGADVILTVTFDAAAASVNTVQTVITYSPANFTFISMTPGAAFQAAFPNSAVSGSIEFSAGSTTPVTGLQTVATITLRATAAGTSGINLAPVCATGDFRSTCSAAYDSTTSDNVLANIVNGNYVVKPVQQEVALSVPANLRSTAVTSKSVSLAWDASTGSNLAGYKLYRNGSLIATLPGTTYTNNRLASSTSYTYTVAAYDAAGNNSAQSDPPLTVTTLHATSSKKPPR